MIISARIIRKPRKFRWCQGFDCINTIAHRAVRVYGMAEVGDPPYVLYLCGDCANREEIQNKLAGTGQLYKHAMLDLAEIEREMAAA